ncbi:hypothetical protein [Streptomyces vinaceus]|uniref:hypothetical protein n=1 Tax=Streptomyces vinaceus TaxID=1960 RepID=UPI0038027B29
MARKELRPQQREAVDAVLRALELPAGGRVPASGLRTQVIMATGSGRLGRLTPGVRWSAPA